MNITEIKIRRLYHENRLRAIVSITIDNELAVHDIKIIEGPHRLFVAMPSRKEENGLFRDIVHPISVQTRNDIESLIIDEYYRYVDQYGVEKAMEASPPAENSAEEPVIAEEKSEESSDAE